ncbi:tetratricopeptide repeat protein [Streptomyces sp. NBC_01190]|uniref:serine/threonine-protein kinase n=1 Tax=Streptomyces sp. NBC_01190 TaxID=2903767 RepID=UPI003866ABC4|nr:protein kinase [Streptomyces sp. NBC_01190]
MTACVRPDCSGGQIEADGFCATCGRAPIAPGRTLVLPDAEVEWTRTPWDDGTDTAVPLALTLPRGPGRALVRAALGFGVVEIAALRARDPDDMLMDEAEIEEAPQRCLNPECPSVRAPAERGRGPRRGRDRAPGADPGRGRAPARGKPAGPAAGRCPYCGTSYAFRRPLRPGEIVGHQYRVRGCIGRGGQGWVYLASDLNLDDDPVAIKGLRDTAEPGSEDVPAEERRTRIAAERRTLIEVKHPDIVDIRNFVQRRDPESGRFDDYIVLEFLGGESLAQKAKRRGVLPVAEAIAYVLAVLPALGYLHDTGLAYCDFKPANIMHVRDRTKLIDLGGVRPIGGHSVRQSWITTGFTAPEIYRGASPSVASDIYAVGRTLAVLTALFDYTGDHRTTLPAAGAIAEFGRYESFYRFLRRATATRPEHRFTSVAHMAEQLVGVLREVVAQDSDRPPARPSSLFSQERGLEGTDPRARLNPVAAALALPLPLVQDSDPGAAFLGTVTATEPEELIAALQGAPPNSAEVTLRRALAQIGIGRFAEAAAELGTVDPRDWRWVWYRGLLHLASGEPGRAGRCFAAIRDALPGEPAPKLALAVCAESLGETALARHYYQTVWRTDDAFVGAAFGVARTYVTESSGETDHAVKVLESLPETLHHHLAARVEALYLRLSRTGLDETGLRAAASRLQDLELADRKAKLGLKEEQKLGLRIELWKAARKWLDDHGSPAEPGMLLNIELTPEAVGRALEQDYLACRPFARNWRGRAELVRQAHAVRPWTRW